MKKKLEELYEMFSDDTTTEQITAAVKLLITEAEKQEKEIADLKSGRDYWSKEYNNVSNKLTSLRNLIEGAVVLSK